MKFNLVAVVGLLLAAFFSGFSDAQFNFLGFRLPSFRYAHYLAMHIVRFGGTLILKSNDSRVN